MDMSAPTGRYGRQPSAGPRSCGKLPERPSDAEVRTACATLEVSRATLFRWLKRYRDTGRTSALLPRRRGPPQAMEPLAPEVLAVVEAPLSGFLCDAAGVRHGPACGENRRRLSTKGSRAALDPPAWSMAGSAGSGGSVAPARGKRKVRAGVSRDAGDPASGRTARHCRDRPHESGRHRRRSGEPKADRPSDADPGDRRRHAHGDGLSPLARAAVSDGRCAVFDACGDGQDRLVGCAGHRRRVAGARHSAGSFTSTTAPSFTRWRSSGPVPSTGSISATGRRERRASAAISSG